MRRIIRLQAIIILCLILTSFSIAYDGPVSGGFFPIGWSEKGDVFAYGYYVGSIMSQDVVHMVVRIQNVVNDSILFRYAKTWEQSYRGDDLDTHLPASAKHAWKEIAEVVNKELTYYGITDLKVGNGGLYGFPHGDYFDAELRPFEAEPGYGLYIKRDDGKEKMVTTYSEELGGKTENLIQGFVWSHNKKRIAIITRLEEEESSDYQVIGCHMKFGFK